MRGNRLRAERSAHPEIRRGSAPDPEGQIEAIDLIGSLNRRYQIFSCLA
jgi:hypothetical protein